MSAGLLSYCPTKPTVFEQSWEAPELHSTVYIHIGRKGRKVGIVQQRRALADVLPFFRVLP
jgi:hypothetical protein